MKDASIKMPSFFAIFSAKQTRPLNHLSLMAILLEKMQIKSIASSVRSFKQSIYKFKKVT